MTKKYLKFSEPLIEKPEIAEVIKTLNSGWLTTGKKTKLFEDNFKKYKKTKYALAVNSCTAALHLSLLCLKLKKNDEVITSALTFASTVNSIVHSGGKPVIADVEFETQNIDPDAILKKINKKTKAIIVVHFAGRPCDMKKIKKICIKFKLKLIEDCAHSIETLFHGKNVGSFGDFGCFSFYATKNLVTGEGGMLTTNNKKYYEKAKVLSLHGMDKDAFKRFGSGGYKHYDVSEIGFKYNMMDLQAAIGIHQLKKINESHKKRKIIWDIYNKNFRSLAINLPKIINNKTKHAYHLYTILINKKNSGLNRDEFIKKMHKFKIGIGIHYRSMPEHSVYKKKFSWKLNDYPNAKKIGRETVSIPLSPKLTLSDIKRVVIAVKKIVKKKPKVSSNKI